MICRPFAVRNVCTMGTRRSNSCFGEDGLLVTSSPPRVARLAITLARLVKQFAAAIDERLLGLVRQDIVVCYSGGE